VTDKNSWAAVVVNYNGGSLLIDGVRSILDDTSAGSVELVVVDNASSDGSIAALEAAIPEVRVVHSPGNVGYARAANLGAAATRAPIVAVCNADVTVEPGTAAAMLARFESDAQVGACGPRVRNEDGTDYPSARQVPSLPVAIGHGALGLWAPRNRFTVRYRELDADPARARDVDWLSGAAIFFRRDALDAVGGWDERYFMYMEDIDLGWRLKRAGWRVVYEPGGSVVHVQGASTSRRPYRMLLEHHRSAWRFAQRRLTGVRALLLPFAAVYLGLRAVASMAEHALRGRTATTRPARRRARAGG
jgi:N-acetylglucosaminyl-diphospho-decaprenol L-rhamnosyltransferase